MLTDFLPYLINAKFHFLLNQYKAAYRVGDSVTNIISPMMSYFALIIAFVGKYDPKAGI